MANKPDEDAFERELARIARENTARENKRLRDELLAEAERRRKAKEDEANQN